MSTATQPGPDRILLTELELAEALGVCRRTVARLRKGGLPCIELRVPGRTTPIVRFDATTVHAWLAAHARGEVPAPEPEPAAPAPRRRGRPRRQATI